MKWNQIEITGKDGTVYKGEKARSFVEANCSRLWIKTYREGKIVVELPDGRSAKPEIVKGHLEDLLQEKVKSIKIITGAKPIIVNFPVARAVPNVVNVNLARLKVQFIYKRIPNSSSPKIFLENEKVKVKAFREGSEDALSKVINSKGIADFGVVLPGKYKIVPDYSELDECKYDWIEETRDVLLEPLDAETIEFQVEPLYQKVQFIAHCLLTIPHQIFVQKENDNEKLVASKDSDGKTKLTFKQKPVVGLFGRGDLQPPLPRGATITADKQGVGKLTLGRKTLFWQLGDLAMNAPDLKMLEIGEMKYDNTYDATIKEGYTHEELNNATSINEMMEVQLPPSGDKKSNPKYYLRLKEKKNYWTLDELDKPALNLDMINIGETVTHFPNIYKIEFKEGFTMPDPPKMGDIRKAVIDQEKGTLTLLVNPNKINKWKLDDLAETLNPKKIDVEIPLIPSDVYKIAFKERTEFYSESDLEGKWQSKYHGLLDDLKDIEARLNFVKDTLEKAYDKSDKNPTILKIFMIPECFFQGLYGAYIADDAAILVEKLQNSVKDEKWKDWVFSFGTINRVFLGLQPKIVTKEENKTIYEMANHAPVIRGGLGDSNASGDDSTRLIQKLINSEELADEGILIEDENVTKLIKKKELKSETDLIKVSEEDETGIESKRIRPQAVNKNVQFEATDNDNEVAKLLEKLLEDNVSQKFYLLTADLEDEIKKSGIAQVARQIRISTDEGDDLFSEWRKTLKDYEKKLDGIKESEWHKRVEEAEKLEETEKLKELEKVAKEKELKKSISFDIEKGSLNLNDYVFACPRKAGHLFKNIGDAKKVKPCKRLVFGLEICADHADFRINNINTGPNLIDIDIHLVPSAGMKPKKFAARNGGYIFNCDGWNQRLREEKDDESKSDKEIREKQGFPKDEGGRNIETHLDGPSPFKVLTVDRTEKQITPVYPHSAVAKRATDDINVKSCIKPTTILPPNGELSKVIFGYGPGEIHFYPLQDLPK